MSVPLSVKKKLSVHSHCFDPALVLENKTLRNAGLFTICNLTRRNFSEPAADPSI